MKRSSDNVLRVALAAVRDCADTMETQAVSLLEALPTVPMDDELRTRALELNAGLKAASSRVTFELALLQAEMGEGKAEAASMPKPLVKTRNLPSSTAAWTPTRPASPASRT